MEPAPFIDHGRRRLLTALIPVVLVLGLVWIVFIADGWFHLDLHRFGIRPREVSGLIGVLAAPFLHANWDHIAGNSLSALVLGWLLVYFYPRQSFRVLVFCWLVGGFWVWLFARPSYHIGASGVIYGMASFLFFSGVVKRHLAHAGVSFMIMALYGGWIWGVLPIEPEKSWESHLAGGVVGALMSWFYRNVPPAHVPPPLELQDEEFPEEETTAPSTPVEPEPPISLTAPPTWRSDHT